MNKKKWILIMVIMAAVLALILLVFIFKADRSPGRIGIEGKNELEEKVVYYCPMHPDFTADKPGSCPICGMSLVKRETDNAKKAGKNKILYYRNPMDPEVTSPVPMKDSMGMDYVPVYEGEKSSEEAGIYMSPEKQQMIGVKKEKVEKRSLAHEILTVGKVAYDPDLYVAQEEYLQARKTVEATKKSVLSSVSEQSNSLEQAAQKKLLLLGMSQEEIEALAKKGSPQENLYLPISTDAAWVYLVVYEYELGLVKAGQLVAIDTPAFPGETFEGKIIAITPVLNAETRTLRVRVEVNDPNHLFKPEMFVNAKIKIDLGLKLAVPETAVLDTGTRKIVYLAKEGDNLQQREVVLGRKAQGYYEVISGLSEGEVVVTSGNFLVDSESKLKGAIK